ncbi:hypothetical protein RI129_003334 [Pyrocoelia pectoralis]|uniref:Uncharacterized protein n=1 Tax=Pyrocoelia pectoralis TaxID=417401 RepID=A0AAN7ZMX4_9COLE
MSKKTLINKSLSKSSSIAIKRDRSSFTQNRKSLSELSFEEYLKVYWKKYCTTNVPKIKILSHEQSFGNFSNIGNKNVLVFLLTVCTFECSSDVKISEKLEYCGLKNTDIRTIRTILQIYPNIRNLSINGNPNHFQNFYILIKGTTLFHLSARFCQINDRGIKLISNQLKVPYDHPLLSIDLSSNFISDVGAICISEILRINRILISLNIADNWIADLGVHTLVTVLGKFILTQDECVIRRRGVFNYLKDKAKMVSVF